MKYYLILACICLFFLITKFFETAGLNITDGNNYILLAKLVSQGKLLYRDIYLDNFPLMIYISVLYRWVTFGSMHFFNFTSTLEKIAIAALLYAIAIHIWKKQSTAFFVAMTFLCSYTTMTSSFQLGFFTSILFISLAYYLTLKKKTVWAGVFAACAVLVKAYSIFPVFGLFLYIAYEYKYKSSKFILAGIFTALVIMLPTFFWAWPQFIQQTFGFGLIRVPAEPKVDMYITFAQYDFLVLLLLVWNLALWKKNIFVSAGTALLMLFFLLYRDIYYIYFSYFPFFGALGVGYLLEDTIPFFKVSFPKVIFATLLSFALLFSVVTYATNDWSLDNVPNYEKLLQVIKDQKPAMIYGYSYEINAISYLTGIPVYNNMYDITTTQFVSTKTDITEYTLQLMKTKTLIIVDTLSDDKTFLYDNAIVDPSLFEKYHCKRVLNHYLKKTVSGMRNGLAVIRCYEV